MRTETRVRLIALLLLALSLAASGVLAVRLASSVGRYGLAYTDRAEDGDPPQVAVGIAMGAFRGVFVNYLWLRATDAKDKGRYYEAIELARAITTLQPRFPRVWVFHAWNMAYNISVTTQTPEERWRWVNAGIRLLRDEGIPANPDDMLMHKELGWIFLHKIGGYTDDANQYYKRQLALEWQIVLGEPPEHDWDDRSPMARTRQFADWLRPVVDAPDTLRQLRERTPAAAELADKLRDGLGEPLGVDLLRRHALEAALEETGELDAERAKFGAKTRSFDDLLHDPAYADAWPALLAFVRKRVLIDDYHMEPLRMLQMTEEVGPIDWRLPAAHGLYWAWRGVQVGRMEVDERNTDSFDFVNTYRIVVQSLQDLWRYGELYFNFLDTYRGLPGYYQAVNQPDFVESYGAMMDEAVANGGIFESSKRVYRPYAAGYENLLEDVISYYYRRGDRENAERWYHRLRTWAGANIHAPYDRRERLSKTLDEFVQENLHERYDSPTVVVQEVYAALQGAYLEGLLLGDTKTFQGMFSYALQEHKYYQNAQFRNIAAGGATGRTEYLDRDFRFVAGMLFAEIATQLPPAEAEQLYTNAPNDLRQYAYDALAARYRRLAEQRGEEIDIDMLFPEPPGMDEFREKLRQKLEERSNQAIQGAQEK